MRIFANKWFHRWAAKESVSDETLCLAAQEIIDGRVEADLGGGLFKKRLPRPGGGKSGGYRVLVGYKRPHHDRVFFLFAFAKNQRANISASEKTALCLVAEAFITATDAQIAELVRRREIREMMCHE